MFDAAFVRRHFPAVTDDWALFDNAGGSAPLAAVVDRVADYMRRSPVQIGATYRHSAEASARVAEGRAAMARLVNCDPDEIVLGASSAMNVQVLARALAPTLSPGDEIVVTSADHESNIGPWRRLEAQGLVVREWAFDPGTLELTAAGLEPLLNARTRLVCFTQVANVVGSIHDAASLVRLVHEAGAQACVDGVAFAPHRRVDVRTLDADYYFFSGYKVFGPHVGVLYGKRERLLAAKGQNHFFVGEDDVPRKLEPGGAPHELVASLAAIPEYLLLLDEHLNGVAARDDAESERLGRVFDAISRYEATLAEPILDFLRARPGVRILGCPDADPVRRVATIAFTVDGADSAAIASQVDRAQVGIRSGHFYAYRAIEALGLLPQNGVVRVSLAHYNTKAEVARLLTALEPILSLRR